MSFFLNVLNTVNVGKSQWFKQKGTLRVVLLNEKAHLCCIIQPGVYYFHMTAQCLVPKLIIYY